MSESYSTSIDTPTSVSNAQPTINAGKGLSAFDKPPSNLTSSNASFQNPTKSSRAFDEYTKPSTRGDGTAPTHFHSFFYDTFTWKYPRTSGVLFAGSLVFLLVSHYVNLLRYGFKGAYIVFAATAALEFVGRPVTGQGFMTQVRPHKYYSIPRENLEMFFSEVHDFLNFVVFEVQRLVYVENLGHTIAAFALSLLGYFLIKYLPIWGLILVVDVSLFSLPLIYIQNQEVIDSQLHKASSIINGHVNHAKDVAGNQAAVVTNKAKAYATDIQGKVTGAYQDRQKIAPTDSTTTKKPVDITSKPTDFSTKPISADPLSTPLNAVPTDASDFSTQPKVPNVEPFTASDEPRRIY